jgi:hypothetical protein
MQGFGQPQAAKSEQISLPCRKTRAAASIQIAASYRDSLE